MVLTLDIGNTQMTGGVYDKEKLIFQFRYTTSACTSSDELGIFMRTVLRENDIDPQCISKIACCSVVPSLNYPLTSACIKYFHTEPLMIKAGIKTGLKLKYGNPKEIGADRIAAAIGAVSFRNDVGIIIVDMGTATTVDILTKNHEYLGGAILSGLRLSMHALSNGTAQLPSVAIERPDHACGSTTSEAIQSGLFYGALGAIKELISVYQQEVFCGEKPFVIGTGGFSHLFADSSVFDIIIPSLVLDGLYSALRMNNYV